MNCFKCGKEVKKVGFFNYPTYDNKLNLISIQHEVDYQNNFKCKESE